MKIIDSNIGFLKRRYKRFFVDIITEENKELIVHCPNNGRMTGLVEEGIKVIFSKINSTLGLQWQMAYVDNTWVGVNTMVPNRIFKEFFIENPLKIFRPVEKTRIVAEYNTRPITGDNHRIDFLIENCPMDIEILKKHMEPNQYITYNPSNPVLVEVKNVHWKKKDGCAFFPDCVTTRGTSQVNSLCKLSTDHYNILICFVIQRSDCRKMTVDGQIDPLFFEAISKLVKKGAIVLAICCDLSPEFIKYKNIINFFIN